MTKTRESRGLKILVAVIAYNEGFNIAATLRDLAVDSSRMDFVVVDDGSTDKTLRVCQDADFQVLRHCVNSGSFGTVKTYFMYAYRHGYDILCQFDGDGQHLASELPKIIGPVERNEADYVIGSRFQDRKGFQSSAIRILKVERHGNLCRDELSVHFQPVSGKGGIG